MVCFRRNSETSFLDVKLHCNVVIIGAGVSAFVWTESQNILVYRSNPRLGIEHTTIIYKEQFPNLESQCAIPEDPLHYGTISTYF